MKSRLALFCSAVFMIVGLSLPASEPGTSTSVFPSYLPIGSREKFMDWVVTNKMCTVSVMLTHTNLAGQKTGLMLSSPTYGLRFDSYQSFRDYYVRNGLRVYERVRTNMSPDTLIDLEIMLGTPLRAGYLLIKTNLGLGTLVNSNSFYFTSPTYADASVEIMEDLTEYRLRVDLDESESYSYEWHALGNWQKQIPSEKYPKDIAFTNLIVLHEWYGTSSEYRIRVSLIAGTSSMDYTQDGAPLVAPVLRAFRDRLEVEIPQGADTSIEWSPDLKDWSPMPGGLFSWSLRTNKLSIPVDPSLFRFYRAKCW